MQKHYVIYTQRVYGIPKYGMCIYRDPFAVLQSGWASSRTCHPRGNLFCIHSVSSGLFYEGANFMINGLPAISIKFFSELAGIIILS